jgi:thiol-disulfide isomerase/thioredoxin
MKNMSILRPLALLAGATLAASTQAAETTLKVGDPAPKLQVAKWVQGDAVKEFESGKAYVVEFWATWCGPCKVSIPHLNELHEKFKDKGLIVIGQDCWERDESLVEPFIKKMGDKMTYRVALDDKSKETDGAMAVTWMKAAGQNGIPSAFVVNKQGKIAWIGHPMTMKEKLLEDVLADRFDLKAAALEQEQQAAKQEQLMALSRKLQTSMAGQKWDDADAAVTEIEKVLTEEQRVSLGVVRFQILNGKKDYPGAYKFLDRWSESHADNAELQNQMAWMVATQPGLENRDLAVGEKIAERGNKAAGGKNANLLDTLARLQFMNGKKEVAVATQQKALELAEADQKTAFTKTLESYQRGELPKAE